MARIRSPNYPAVSLPEAISRTANVFSKEHRHPAPKDVVVQHLGYSGLNGASLKLLSALVKYGLLERNGEDYQVSDLAMSILHPATSQEKAEALKRAATSPALYGEILDHFKGVLPSDENLRSYLIRRGFSEGSLQPVIQALRETFELVAPSSAVHTGSGSPKVLGAPMHATVAAPVTTQTFIPPMPKNRSKDGGLRVSLTDEGLEVSAELLDQKSVERLIAILEANKVLLPKSSDKPKQDATVGDLATEDEAGQAS